MKLGELLKSYRTEHKLSMDAFCELSDLTKGYISMLEKNEHPKSKKPIVPSYDTIEKIAKGMQISTEDLIDMLDDDQEIQINATPALLSKSPIQTIYDELEPPGQGKVLNYAKRQLKEQRNEEETKINEVSENIIRLDDYRQTTYRRVTGVV
ncbi:helix-turn-helix transcriptional regulator, partial [Streptococcus pneumoniae]|nr:helix-turn-helix transcriptional regulator [Streptococcus pneumoniae]